MLTTLDRYIIRQFLGTFFFILVVIMAHCGGLRHQREDAGFRRR
jgi:lipopolysaccharide export LptBFGC system permease protein LptF